MNDHKSLNDIPIRANGGLPFGELSFDRYITDYKLEDFILNTKWEDFPEDVKKRAIVCSIDLIMALKLGSHGRQHAVGVRVVEEYCKEGDIPIVGSSKTFNFLGAAMAMGHASNSFDIDDGYNLIRGHPGTSFIAGTMAAALEKNVSYKEYLTTLVVAYEVVIRYALSMQKYYGFYHSSGTYGAFGTAAGIGRLYGFSREQLNNALSIADFHAPLVPSVHSAPSPTMNKDGVPFGALIGTMAVLETMAGYTGKGNVLEIPEVHPMVDTLGKWYEILNLYFKPYTCCRHTHQPIAAIISLKEEHPFGAEDVEAAKVYTYTSAYELTKEPPHSTDAAQYNISYPVACALVHGDVGFEQIREEALGDPQVLSMMNRLEIVVDPELDAQFHKKRQARVEVYLKDGTVLRSGPTEAPGEAKDGVDYEWIEKKFMRITKPFFSTEKQKKILEMLNGSLDTPIRHIVDFINRDEM